MEHRGRPMTEIHTLMNGLDEVADAGALDACR
jgi:hypothetical protein